MSINNALTDAKSFLTSKTIHGNILSIGATAASLFTIIKAGAPIDVLYTAVVAGVGAIWGNVMSIFGRVSATQKIG